MIAINFTLLLFYFLTTWYSASSKVRAQCGEVTCQFYADLTINYSVNYMMAETELSLMGSFLVTTF